MIDYIETTESETKKPLIIPINEIISFVGFGIDTTEIHTTKGVLFCAESVDNIEYKITVTKRHLKR